MSQSQGIPTWASDSRGLHDLVCEGRVSNERANFPYIQRQLDIHKHKFIALLDDAPQKAEHRSAIKTGTFTVNGVKYSVNQQFIDIALNLSDQLCINEYIAASILSEGLDEPNTVGDNAIEVAILLYHTERCYLLATLDTILVSIKDEAVDPDMKLVFHQFIAGLVKEKVTGNANELVTYPTKILQTAAKVKEAKEKLRNDKTSQVTQSSFSLTTATAPKLSEEAKAIRTEQLTEEYLYLLQTLYHIATLFWIDSANLLNMLDTLDNTGLADESAPYLLTAVLGALSPADRYVEEWSLSRDGEQMKKLHERIVKSDWKTPVVKSTLIMQWALSIISISKYNGDTGCALPASESERDQLVDEVSSAGTFKFMNDYLLYFQKPTSLIDIDRSALKEYYTDDSMIIDGQTVDPNDYTKFNVNIVEDFQLFIVHTLETLSLSLIDAFPGILRKLKYREEDSIRVRSGERDTEPCRDLEAFFTLLASIYRGRMNAGYEFWDHTDEHKLISFVKLSADLKVVSTVGACYNFFASLATGDKGAEYVYACFRTGTNGSDLASSALFSWGKLFAALQFYTPLLRGTQGALPAEEEDLLIKFLNLLKQVVQHSGNVRHDLWNDPVLRVRDSLIDMLGCPTSTGLRVTLYEVLAGFCSQSGTDDYKTGKHIAHSIWQLLEESGVLIGKQSPPVSLQRTYLPQEDPLFLKELHMERESGIYTKTLAILRLLAAAIHTQSKADELVSGFAAMASSVPYDLGKDTRTPGGAPYIAFVVDHVLQRLPSQRYLNTDHRWQLTEACLRILENSVLSFDIQPLVEMSSPRGSTDANLLNALQRQSDNNLASLATADLRVKLLLLYLAHPGFEVITRILSGTNLLVELLKIVEYEREPSKGREINPGYGRCIVRCLRIIYRVIEVQNIVANLLFPQIVQASMPLPSGEYRLSGFLFPALPRLYPLGQLLLYHMSALTQVALLVSTSENLEASYMSTKILQALSTEPTQEGNVQDIVRTDVHCTLGGLGTRLSSVLAASSDAKAIVYQLYRRLEINESETMTYLDYERDIDNIPFWRAWHTLKAIEPNTSEGESGVLIPSVRQEIMDMLLSNAALKKPSPTITEFLLGYDTMHSANRGNEILRRSCLDVILNILGQGMEDLDLPEADRSPPLIVTHPIFAEKCYQLVYLLCAKETTSLSTVHHLRAKNDFFYVQLRGMAPRLETYAHVERPIFEGHINSRDHSRISSDFFTLRSQLHQRAWFLKTIALELHLRATHKEKTEAVRLLTLLYVRQDTPVEDDISNYAGNSIFLRLPDEGFDQPLASMLEIMSSLDFTWTDSLGSGVSKETVLNFFKDVKLADYQKQSQRGCTVHDIRSIYKRLRDEQRKMERSEPVGGETDWMAVENEMGRFLEDAMAENHLREIAHARLHCIRAWKQVVQMTLSDCFDLLAFETRESIAYSLLSLLLPKIQSASRNDGEVLKDLSEIVLALLTRLREDKHRQFIFQTSSSNVLPTRLPDEKLQIILSGIVSGIQQEGMPAAVRGDLYTALTHFLHYINPTTTSLGGSEQLCKYVVGFISSTKESFLNRICDDATNGTNLSKSTAYVALDALYALMAKTCSIQPFLVKKNFLQYSVDMIRREDNPLLQIIQCRDVALTPLYAYEAKMALFLRIALQADGAVLLLESRVLDVLGQCQFLDAVPNGPPWHKGAVVVDASERYERLLVPALELVIALTCSLGGTGRSGLDKVEEWTKGREVLVNVLKDAHQQQQQRWTLSGLNQLRLTTLLIYQLSKRPSFFESLEDQRCAKLHTAMLHLMSFYLRSDDLATHVIPSNAHEEDWSKLSVPSAGSVLANKAKDHIVSIQKNLIAYAQNATFAHDKQGAAVPAGNVTFKPVFAQTLSASKETRASTKIPSLTVLSSYIEGFAKDLQVALTDHRSLCLQKENVRTLNYEELHGIAKTAIPPKLGIKYDQLHPAQQQQLLATELETRRASKLKQIQSMTIVAELVLVVLWRHCEFYLQPSSAPSPTVQDLSDLFADLNVSRQQTVFLPSTARARELRSAGPTVLEPVLARITSLDLSDVPDTHLKPLCARVLSLFE